MTQTTTAREEDLPMHEQTMECPTCREILVIDDALLWADGTPLERKVAEHVTLHQHTCQPPHPQRGAPTMTQITTLCHICQTHDAMLPATICFGCSAQLRMGMTIEVRRTYLMPHESHARIRFRAGHAAHDVEWLFVGEDRRYRPYTPGTLTS